MADRTEANGSHPVVVTDSTWSQLLAETVDEVARIVRTEIGLAEASLRRMFENQTERVLGSIFLLVALVYGSIFVLGGVVLLIHQWLAWWMAFGITGIVIILAGFGFQTIMTRRAASKSSLTSSGHLGVASTEALACAVTQSAHTKSVHI